LSIKNRIPTKTYRLAENAVARELGDWLVLGGIALFGAVTFICPMVRAFYHFQINYVEGWDVYNALKVTQHIPLYGEKYGWTTVNYPALSFYVSAYLSHFTHSYLLTMRLLSLISLCVSCFLVGLIVRKLTGELSAAFFAGFFCLALFCTHATGYVGMTDPQIFAQVFFLGGLLLYVSRPPTIACMAAIALLFILGGNIKHNLIEFPLAVFIDLWMVSRRRAGQFVVLAIPLAAIAIALNIKYGGAFFISNLLHPRTYSVLDAFGDFFDTNGAILLPYIVAIIWVVRNRKDAPRRLICIFFVVALFVDMAFSGGIGIAINIYFGSFLALSIIMGLVVHDVWRTAGPFANRSLWRRGVPMVLSASLFLTLFLSGYSRILNALAKMPDEQRQFDAETSFIGAQPGLAMCEMLLHCYDAGKEYVFDPFNSTRLVLSHRLDVSEIVDKIETHQFGAIQLDTPGVTRTRPNQRFPDEVLDAVSQYYVVGYHDAKCVVYVPKAAQ
jgi:hypothetical protein